MADMIPKMPEPFTHADGTHCEGDGVYCGEYIERLETYAHNLTNRLAASNALCAELAEALGVADEALNFLARYYLPDGRDAREVVKAALAKFKEATR